MKKTEESSDAPSMAEVSANVREARAELAADVAKLRRELSPDALQERVKEKAAETLQTATNDVEQWLRALPSEAMRFARSNPMTSAAVVAGVGLLLWQLVPRRRSRWF